MKFTPLGNRVLIKPDEADDKTPGGILLPDAAKEKPRKGKIIAKGGGKIRDDGSVQRIVLDEGDTVLFERYAGTTIELDRTEYLVIDADQLLGVLSVK